MLKAIYMVVPLYRNEQNLLGEALSTWTYATVNEISVLITDN